MKRGERRRLEAEEQRQRLRNDCGSSLCGSWLRRRFSVSFVVSVVFPIVICFVRSAFLGQDRTEGRGSHNEQQGQWTGNGRVCTPP